MSNNQNHTQELTVEALVRWIESNPEYAHLVKQAQNPDQPEAQPTLWKRVQNTTEPVVSLFWADPCDFHGKALVSEELKADSKKTAIMVSFSTIVNGFGNFPILLYAFESMGAWSLLLAMLVNVSILKFTNESAKAASRGKRGTKSWSNWAIASMLSLNLLQSIVAGVGTELLLNQLGLSQRKAEELIELKTAQVEQLRENKDPKYEDALNQCQAGEQELNQLERSNPRWDSLYTRLYGTWAEQEQDWTQIAFEQVPVCRQVDRLRTEAYKHYETANEKWQARLLLRHELGSDLAFLKQEIPVMYDDHFQEDGELKSGIDAARLAILTFLEKFSSGDLAGLGFSLFFLLLSLFMSGYACFLSIAHRGRKDTQISLNDAVRQQRDHRLEELRQQL